MSSYKQQPRVSALKSLLQKKNIPANVLGMFGVGYCDSTGDVTAYGNMAQLEGANCTGPEHLIFPLVDLHGVRRGYIYRTEALKSFYSNDVKPQELLYGLCYAYASIQERGCCFLVEGMFDVLTLHAAGAVNTVASLGSHLSEAQAILLSRFTDSVFVCYDPDEAGETGAAGAVTALAKAGVSAVSVRLPADPDDVVRANGLEEFYTLCESALSDTTHAKDRGMR